MNHMNTRPRPSWREQLAGAFLLFSAVALLSLLADLIASRDASKGLRFAYLWPLLLIMTGFIARKEGSLSMGFWEILR